MGWGRRRIRENPDACGPGPGRCEARPAAASAPDAEAALDALAAVLRAWGEVAFDLDDRGAQEVRDHFEAWARHVRVGAPGPDGDPGLPASRGRRDWPGLTRFVTEHRRLEVDSLTRRLADLRQVVWVFVQGLGRALLEDQSADAAVAEHLERLRESAERGDVAALKREALSAVALVERVTADRRERQRAELRALAGRIDEIRKELARAREQLEIDALTEVYSRGALDEYLQRIVDLRRVSGHACVLFVIDVDDFKWVNDRFGHAAGDDVLRAVAARIQQCFRRGSDFVARFGGDEFVVVVPNDSLAEAQQLGACLVHSMRDLEVPNGSQPIRVTLSAGAAKLAPGEDARAWLERADRLLYAAKQAGRDRLVVEAVR